MSVQLIGLIIAALAGVALIHSRAAAFAVLCVALLLQAAAAIILTSLGGSSITPGYLTIFFFAFAVLIRNNGLARVTGLLTPNRPEFVFLVFVVWAIFISMVMPRVFQGMFTVYPLGEDNPFGALQKRPVGPLTSNLTQSVYYIGDLVVVLFVGAMLASMNNLRIAAMGVLAAVVANLGFVVLDLFTFMTGTEQLMSFMRNATYAQMSADIVLGVKRITGSFTEASSFAIYSLGLFAFVFRLWRGGVNLPFTGVLAFATGFALIMSTSSTAFAAFGLYLAIVFSREFSGADRTLPRTHDRVAKTGFLLSMVPVGALAIASVIALRPEILDPVTQMIDEMLINKLSSESGAERTNWNMSGLQNIVDSYGLGIGLGSNRTSSFAIALVSATGVIGGLLFLFYLTRVFTASSGAAPPPNSPDAENFQIAAAARSGMVALLIALVISAGVPTPGTLFYIFAAIAAFKYRPVPASRRSVRPPQFATESLAE